MDVATRNYTDRRQLDIPLTTQYHFIIPSDVKGRVTTEDFIFFNPTNNILFDDYDVIVESFNGSFKKIGELSNMMKLPHVLFSDISLVLVLPKTDRNKPRFMGIIQRGKIYNLFMNHLTDHGFYLLS
jgi:hypothetical protein